jgi:hypothetical protein
MDMTMKYFRLIITLLTFFKISSVFADYVIPTFSSYQTQNLGVNSPNNLSISFLAGKAKLKQKSAKQDGWLYGVRANYDFISPCNIYFGSEIGYKRGTLKGHTKTLLVVVFDEELGSYVPKDKIKSNYSDFWGELRLGYTFGSGYTVSPYFVVGYEKEITDFLSPSPLEIKKTLTYGYFGVGAISNFLINQCFAVGVNFKLKWMFATTDKTNGEDFIFDKNISCAGCFHYEVEVPFSWYFTQNIKLSIAPFYQYKNYDTHKYDVADKEKSTLHFYGLLVQGTYVF